MKSELKKTPKTVANGALNHFIHQNRVRYEQKRRNERGRKRAIENKNKKKKKKKQQTNSHTHRERAPLCDWLY